MVVEVVGAVETGLIAVGAVGIFHRELAHTNQTAARSWLVAPLRLEVIHLLWELAPRVDQLAQEVSYHLFVRHRQDHVAATAIVEATHLRTDLVIAPRLAPEVGGVHDWHQHLLRTDRVHLFTNDLGDAHVDAHAEREERVDSRTERSNVPSTEQEAMRRHLRVGGVLPEGRKEEFAHAHGVNPTRARGSRSGGVRVRLGGGGRSRSREPSEGRPAQLGSPPWPGVVHACARRPCVFRRHSRSPRPCRGAAPVCRRDPRSQ